MIEEPAVLFGDGRRLFDVLPSRAELEIVMVIDTPDATHIRYPRPSLTTVGRRLPAPSLRDRVMTPEAVHFGRVDQMNEVRSQTLAAAYAAHPERFVRKPPSIYTGEGSPPIGGSRR